MADASLVQVLAGVGALGGLGVWAEVVRRNRRRSLQNQTRSRRNERRLVGDDAMDRPSIGAELAAIKEDTEAIRRQNAALARSHNDLVQELRGADALDEADLEHVDSPIQPDGGEE